MRCLEAIKALTKFCLLGAVYGRSLLITTKAMSPTCTLCMTKLGLKISTEQNYLYINQGEPSHYPLDWTFIRYTEVK